MHRGNASGNTTNPQRGPPPSSVGGTMLGGGFNKPPPAPQSTSGGSHAGPQRTRGHSVGDVSGSLKDKLSTLGGAGVPPCSLSSSREKSPNSSGNATIPDFHDCSMCLSAYIQSLNTVCGSASRLSQCLAGLSNVSGSNNTSTQQCLRETCEGWESLTRAVGVASASVKAHMLALLQDATNNVTTAGDEMGEGATGQDMEKLLASLCSSFLSLQCQFSGAVLETFAPYRSLMLTPPLSSMDTPISQYSTPITPPHFSAQLTPPHGGNFFPNHPPPSTNKTRTRANSMNHLNPPTGLQPSSIANTTDTSTVRRWSMGANSSGGNGGYTDKLEGGGNISGPGPPRRWSVPEANEPPPSSTSSNLNAVPNLWSMASIATPWGPQQQSSAGGSDEINRRLSVPVPQASSRESSAGGSRSNSHSRSATPDATKSFISNDELEELTDMLNGGSDKAGGRRSSSSHSRQGGGSVSSAGDEKEAGGNLSENKSLCQHNQHHQKSTSCNHHKQGACLGKTKASDISQNTVRKEGEGGLSQLEPKPPEEKGGTKGKHGGSGVLKKGGGGYVKGLQNKHPKQRTSYQQHHNKQYHQQYNLQQYQLQQYLYQQQLQANAYLKLSPISSSILKQQQQAATNYLPLLQQHFYQQQLQQQLKLNQSLQLLHLQQQRFSHQHRKNSLQNIGSYYHDTGGGSTACYFDTPDDSSCGTSRRGSANTTSSSCSSGGGGTGRTPVIHEASAESGDNVIESCTISQQWQKQNKTVSTPPMKTPTIQMEGRIVNAPTLPEVVTTSTPLWPPSGSVPGVTLTECTEDFRSPRSNTVMQSGWPTQNNQIGVEESLISSSSAASTGSWPPTHPLWGSGGFSLGGLIEDATLGGLIENQPTHKTASHLPLGHMNMRRHSTDTSLFHHQHQSEFSSHPPAPPALSMVSPVRNSRSSDNLTMTPDLNEISQSNLESLLTLNALLPSSSPPSPTAHYSLFNS